MSKETKIHRWESDTAIEDIKRTSCGKHTNKKHVTNDTSKTTCKKCLEAWSK